jgi:hypothetical protein
MAAVTEPASKLPSAELIELRDLRSDDLKGLLQEETEVWREALEWDFHSSAELVERFVDQRALNGFALMGQGTVFGYSYFVHDEHKGLIGDLYVRRALRSAEHENRLLAGVVESLMRMQYVTRIETQLMMLGPGHSILPGSRFLKTYDRNFMRIDLTRARLDKGRVRRPVYFEKWTDHYNAAAAQLIADAYAAHTDSRINDQYRSRAGALATLTERTGQPEPTQRAATWAELGALTDSSVTRTPPCLK